MAPPQDQPGSPDSGKFSERMYAARAAGWEFLGTGEQNTHLHTLAFQMRMLLMRDLAGTGQLLGGRQVPGIESRSRQVARFPLPRSPFPQSLQAEPTHLHPGDHRRHRGLGHLLATRSISMTGLASPPCCLACLPCRQCQNRGSLTFIRDPGTHCTVLSL